MGKQELHFFKSAQYQKRVVHIVSFFYFTRIFKVYLLYQQIHIVEIWKS